MTTWRERQHWGIRSEDNKSYRRARFRGAEFWVDLYERDSGRRLSIQKFPGSQFTSVQDLGADSDRFSITAWFGGDNYDVERNALEQELLKGGQGRLELPWRDPIEVTVVGRIQTQESKKGRGFCTLKFSCLETGTSKEPFVTVPIPKIRVAGVALREGSASRFRDAFDKVRFFSTEQKSAIANVMDTATRGMAEVQSTLDAKIGQINRYANRVSSLFGSVNSLLNLPLEFSDAIIDSVITVYSSAKSSTELAKNVALTWGKGGPIRYLADVTFGFGNSFTPIVSTPITDTDRETQDAQNALHRFISLQMLIEMLLSLIVMEFESYQQAIEVRDGWTGLMREFTEDSDDPEHQEIAVLNTAFVEHVNGLLEGLPRVTLYTPAQELPMLVISNLIYGSADRDLDLAERNRVPHPGFVEDGVAIEVIRV